MRGGALFFNDQITNKGCEFIQHGGIEMARYQKILGLFLFFLLIVNISPVNSEEGTKATLFLRNGQIVECDKAWIASKDTVRCKKGMGTILYSIDDIVLGKSIGVSVGESPMPTLQEESAREERLSREGETAQKSGVGSGVSYSLPRPARWTGNINGFFGMKYLDEDDWEPLEEQTEFSVKLDFKQQNWPVSIAIDLLGSSDESTLLYYYPAYGYIPIEVEVKTSELCLGVRKTWDHFATVRPFIGGGLAMINADIEGEAYGLSVSDDDDAMGYWIEGGIYWTLAEHFNIGFNVRWSKAEVTIYGVEAEAGGTHGGLLLGYHW